MFEYVFIYIYCLLTNVKYILPNNPKILGYNNNNYFIRKRLFHNGFQILYKVTRDNNFYYEHITFVDNKEELKKYMKLRYSLDVDV